MKKIVGISASIIIDGGGAFPGYRRSYVNEDYVNSVIKNGGLPYILPMNADKDVISEQVEHLDALILSGGQDVNPLNYGQGMHQKCSDILPERDEFDFELLRCAKKKGIPILGICRGLQIINAYHKGTIFQDLSLKEGIYLKHNQVHSPSLTTHKISITKGSKLNEILGQDEAMVNSFHHQILDKVASGFKVSAISDDGAIEAIEAQDYDFLLGVQWHPEMLHKEDETMNKLFSELIRNA